MHNFIVNRSAPIIMSAKLFAICSSRLRTKIFIWMHKYNGIRQFVVNELPDNETQTEQFVLHKVRTRVHYESV